MNEERGRQTDQPANQRSVYVLHVFVYRRVDQSAFSITHQGLGRRGTRRWSPHTRYVLWLMESPSYLYGDLEDCNNVFNWTFTHRLDSDFFLRYNQVFRRHQPLPPTGHNYALGKTKLAAWFVSHCSTDSGRITLDVVPVVFGLGNCSAQAPPHSYIDALSFPSVSALADYLLYLHHNDTAYNEYFRWKRHHQMFSFWALTSQEYCSLCERLHTDNTTKAYDMYKWYVQDAHCKSKSSPDIYDFINAASRISGPNLTLYFVMPYLFVTMFFLYSPKQSSTGLVHVCVVSLMIIRGFRPRPGLHLSMICDLRPHLHPFLCPWHRV